ncbi:hypothetical protein [uncultured Roseobacter sp.]|uniref:hypothetical protein n=1 Tax=uncultured Roseobacter sp. TaxID=114847 RepID=UPI00263068CF|nr:hypothetical protein [uncultured Roseobacter sp.]
MVDRLLAWEQVFLDMGGLKAALFGLAVGITLSAPMLSGFGEGWMFLPFLTYFPVHGWLTVSLLLVLFSGFERERILRGSGHGAVNAFFYRIFSPFGLFCLGWFYSFMTIGFLTGAWE